MMRFASVSALGAFVIAAWLGSQPTARSTTEAPPATAWKPQQVGHPTFVSPHSAPIAISNGLVFVANTPADTLDVIDEQTRKVLRRIPVGVDPVSVAVRPDGHEVWVSNHVSDSVSVIDSNADSPSYLNVVATIQEIDPKSKATRFDEPVGIAFANNDKAYVALSSENQIAVINVPERSVTKRLTIKAQDPRAIRVRGNRLYVVPFESNNKTQLSGGSEIDGDLVTFNAWEHSIRVNNVLSLGHVVDIVKHPKVPDRDLFVFDTETDELVETVDTLGTLLYGLTVDSEGRVYVAQTDARNEVNGRSGTKKHGLGELENRAFLNQITTVDFDGDRAAAPQFMDLEPLPPAQPARDMALATPFAIEVTDDDATLVVSAAGSDKLFTLDATTGKVLGRVNVGAVPRGIALVENDSHKHAWVLNAVANTVSVVDLDDTAQPEVLTTVALEDPTHPAVKRGRIAFNTAAASTTHTFSCASCHPDGHTDQLLWVLKTPIVTGGDQIMPRSTMPIRGLRDTAPYHWDGIPGDPYGGNNSANIHGSDPPNSSREDAASTTRHLIDGGLASTMAMVGAEGINDEGKPGALSAAERQDMATFLLSVPYPPAQRRAFDNVVSDRAREGFKLFHIDGDLDGKVRPNVCGNCHRMPFLVSTNTPGTGMDAPTWRGAYDRFLILPQGRLNIIDFDFYARVADQGNTERNIWQFSWGGRRRFDPVWEMVLEGSTGYSGSFARQVTLNENSADNELTTDILRALEHSAAEGAIVLEAEGLLIDDSNAEAVAVQFDPAQEQYVSRAADGTSWSREDLLTMAQRGDFVGTFTGRHGVQDDVEHPQPGLWTRGPIEQQRGRQNFPMLYPGHQTMSLSGRHIEKSAHVIVDGRKVPARMELGEDELVTITLDDLPEKGMHLLQVQNAGGMFSNDFIFHVTSDAEAAAKMRRDIEEAHVDIREKLAAAISRGDIPRVKRILRRQKGRLNEQRPDGGSTPLSHAALHGKTEIAAYLIEQGAKVDGTNRDGNTPLHVAAFLCRADIVQLLLEKGASTSIRNGRGETPIDVVSGEWTEDLAGFYTAIGAGIGVEVDLDRVRAERPKIAELLRTAGAKKQEK